MQKLAVASNLRILPIGIDAWVESMPVVKGVCCPTWLLTVMLGKRDRMWSGSAASSVLLQVALDSTF